MANESSVLKVSTSATVKRPTGTVTLTNAKTLAVTNTLTCQRYTDLRDEFAAVRDGTDGHVGCGGDATEHESLARTRRHHAQRVEATACPERLDLVDQNLLIVPCGVHLLFRSDDVDCSFITA